MKNKKQKNNKISKVQYQALGFALAGLLINFWAWSLLSPLGVKLASDFNLNTTSLSLVLALPVLIGAAGRIVLGSLTDKYGGKLMFGLVSLFMLLPVIGMTYAVGTSHLVAVAILLGVGGASFAVGVPFINGWFPPEKRGLAIGLYSMGNIGTAVSGFMTPQLSQSVGHKAPFLVVAILLLAIAFMFFYFAKNPPGWKPSKSSAVQLLKESLRLRITRDLSIIYLITFGAYVAFGVYLPVILKTQHNLELTDAAARSAGFIAIATLGRPIGGWLSDKIGAKRIIPYCLLIISGLSMYIAFLPTLSMYATIAYLSLALILGCSNGAVFALVGRRSPTKLVGSIGGIVGAIGGLGGFLPPLILGATYQTTNSYSLAFAGLSLSSGLVMLYSIRSFRNIQIYPDKF